MDHEGTMSPPHSPTTDSHGKSRPKSLEVAEKGIRTSTDFAAFMSALISDVVSRRVTSEVGNAACNAGGKLLKVVEMQLKYGSPSTPNGGNVLTLAEPTAKRR